MTLYHKGLTYIQWLLPLGCLLGPRLLAGPCNQASTPSLRRGLASRKVH
jgi:hypothetical protein